MAAALHTAHHAHDDRQRQPIQSVMARPELRSANKTEEGQTIFGDWQALVRLCDSLIA